jgi:metal-responsive CopG/Arc/MetJ family transcriptional regulator
MRVVSFKVEEDLLDLMERVARRKGITKSELIRQAVKKYLLDNEEERRVIATRKIKIYL